MTFHLPFQTETASPLDRLSELAPSAVTAIGIALLLVVAWIALVATRRVLLRIVHRVTEKTSFTWDDTLREHRVFHRVAHVAPALVFYYGILLVPEVGAQAGDFVQRVALAFMVVMLVAGAQSLLTAINAIYVAEYEHARTRPIKGYLQILAIFLWIAAGVTVLSILTGQNPLYFLSGLGALTAVLLLVFRTTILSFVASLQIASNDMVRVGDWIEMPKFGADGDVIDIALHTVKVQNWDKTITTVPTHMLVEESFRNWRGMSESGGRRIKRSLTLDMNTIAFLTDEQIEELIRLELLADYLDEKKKELAEYRGMRPDRPESLKPTPRRLTNVGTFRRYMLAYLKAHPRIHQEMTVMVRQLAPGPDGLPIELYCFTNDTAWATYENVQADLFDHFLAIAPDFGLRVFQRPGGGDLEGLGMTLADRPRGRPAAETSPSDGDGSTRT